MICANKSGGICKIEEGGTGEPPQKKAGDIVGAGGLFGGAVRAEPNFVSGVRYANFRDPATPAAATHAFEAVTGAGWSQGGRPAEARRGGAGFDHRVEKAMGEGDTCVCV